MNIKINQALLAALPLIVGLTLPVMAQTAPTLASKAAVNTVNLNEKSQTCSHKLGMCGGGKGRFEGSKGRFEGGPGGFKAERGEGHGRFHRSMFSSLKGENALSDAQLEKIVAIKNDFRQQAEPKVADLFSAERKLRDQMSNTSPDKSQLEALQTQINGDHDALSNLKLASKLQEMDILTPPQKQEIRQSFLKHSLEFGSRG